MYIKNGLYPMIAAERFGHTLFCSQKPCKFSKKPGSTYLSPVLFNKNKTQIGSWLTGSWLIGSWLIGSWLIGSWLIGSWLIGSGGLIHNQSTRNQSTN